MVDRIQREQSRCMFSGSDGKLHDIFGMLNLSGTLFSTVKGQSGRKNEGSFREILMIEQL